jgi:CTP synthase (UTP-ammonia lyase)
MGSAIRIGILGDFNPEFRSHHATNASIQHAADHLELEVEAQWVPTLSLENAVGEALEGYDAVWASPGSPYNSFLGMLRGIEFARRRDWPFVGT